MPEKKGRCVCGLEGTVKKVYSHQVSCPRYLAADAAARGTGAGLAGPAELYEEHQRWINSMEYALQKEEATATKHAGYRAQAEAKIARSKTRWGSHLTAGEAAAVQKDQEGRATDLGTTSDAAQGGSAETTFEQKTIDGVSAEEILANPDAYTKMQVLRAEVVTRRSG